MSSVDFGVTVDEVKEYLPYSSGSISATSHPLNNSEIQEFIYDGAAYFAGIVRRSNISATSGVAQEQLAQGVKFYASRESLAVMGNYGQAYQRASDKVAQLSQQFQQSPQTIDDSPKRVRSNINTNSDKTPATFIGLDKEIF